MNTHYALMLMTIGLALGACAAPAAKPAAAPTAASTTAAKDGVLECTDASPTGSNIRRRRCERVTEEMRRDRQARVQGLQRPGGSNGGGGASDP